MHRRNGFTMIEIVMVLVLTGILAAVAAPKFFDYLDSAEKNNAMAAVAEAQARLNSVFSEQLLQGRSCGAARETAVANASFTDPGGRLGDFIVEGGGWLSGTQGDVKVVRAENSDVVLQSHLILPLCDDLDSLTGVLENTSMSVTRYWNKDLDASGKPKRENNSNDAGAQYMMSTDTLIPLEEGATYELSLAGDALALGTDLGIGLMCYGCQTGSGTYGLYDSGAQALSTKFTFTAGSGATLGLNFQHINGKYRTSLSSDEQAAIRNIVKNCITIRKSGN